jgi:cell division protein FtsW (lipid II flippase)
MMLLAHILLIIIYAVVIGFGLYLIYDFGRYSQHQDQREEFQQLYKQIDDLHEVIYELRNPSVRG